MEKIVIASDHAGYRLKETLKKFLAAKKFHVLDLGTDSLESCDYPEFSAALAALISKGKFKRGILICKSGIGNSIVANRFPGVRAALTYSLKAARLSREHNDSNVLVLGAGFVTYSQAKRITSLWLKTSFLGTRHLRRLNKIKKIEKEIKNGNL